MKLKNTISWKIFGAKSVTFFLAILLVFFVTSCGKRTSIVTESIKKRDTLVSSLIQKNIKVDSNHTVDFSTFRIHPIDLSKPIILDGLKIDNAFLEGTHKKETLKVSKLDKTKTEDIKKGDAFEKKKEKETEKTDYGNVFIGLIFIVCLFIFLYLKTPNMKKPLI